MRADRPDSPCRGVCTTLYDEVCRGCGRHYLEVARWGQMTEQEKEAVWRRLEGKDMTNIATPLERAAEILRGSARGAQGEST